MLKDLKISGLVAASALILGGLPALAQDAPAAAEAVAAVAVETPTDMVFIMNSLIMMLGGILVFWMAAGFAMLEAGLVRSKNVTMQLLKNVSMFALACFAYYIIGYSIMYPGDDWTIAGIFGKFGAAALEAVGLSRDAADAYDYASTSSDFFFQVMFCATAASIVSGTVAERIKLWPFLVFTLVLAIAIYPVQGSWKWGGGFLDEAGFLDFAGSTLVHSVGGWAALTGALIVGPRLGKYKDGRVTAFPGSNLPLALLGTFILWMGWFGFNGASQLALSSVGDAADVGRVMANTNAAAVGGAIAALILTQLVFKKVDLTMVLNGALAGLVSITAEPLTPGLGSATLIGAVGGALVVFLVPLLDKFKIDDVVGAIPVHLGAGIWGTIAVVFTNPDASLFVQLKGIVIIGLFVIVTSAIAWLVIKAVMGLRPSAEDEINGLDKSELGMEAYPEFTNR
ncbi:ammonium transporter family protein [Falsigemmobacter faecalis]|uniref:Ammonium transporter n=1 Tax=Falsigemmobacter faecalis TaxID=2488730 RepID=A0A3P3DR77_9RHOB|nr:ammonium transporter [Falsigemmobacter faecalis]RRH76661.1 ammonium transporter [Falsigemmobacter faecalis]